MEGAAGDRPKAARGAQVNDVSVTAASRLVTLAGGHNSLVVTVKNEAREPQRVVLAAYPPRGAPIPDGVTPSGATPTGMSSGMPVGAPANVADVAGWTTVERPLRQIAGGGTEQYLVRWRRDRLPPGTHEVRFVAYPADRAPEEYVDAGQVVQVVVPTPSPAQHPRRRWWLLALAVVLVGALGAVAFALTRPSSMIVPGVLGQSLADAEATLTAAGLEVAVTSEVGPEPLDTVIRQDPEEGSEVRAGTSVLVVVQVGFVLPDVTGHDVTDAVQELGDVVQVEQVQEESDATPGTVLRMEPAAGTEVGAGTSVRLVIASQRTVPVPNVIGRSADGARATLEEMGLQPLIIEGPLCQLPFGSTCQVFFQNPLPDTQVPLGSTVTVTTS